MWAVFLHFLSERLDLGGSTSGNEAQLGGPVCHCGCHRPLKANNNIIRFIFPFLFRGL